MKLDEKLDQLHLTFTFKKEIVTAKNRSKLQEINPELILAFYNTNQVGSMEWKGKMHYNTVDYLCAFDKLDLTIDEVLHPGFNKMPLVVLQFETAREKRSALSFITGASRIELQNQINHDKELKFKRLKIED